MLEENHDFSPGISHPSLSAASPISGAVSSNHFSLAIMLLRSVNIIFSSLEVKLHRMGSMSNSINYLRDGICSSDD